MITGPTLQSVYEYPRPYYLIQSPAYTARVDMFNGLHRFLADDDDTVRLNGSPLFTLSDGSTELMSEKTAKAFTWPMSLRPVSRPTPKTGRAGRHSISTTAS